MSKKRTTLFGIGLVLAAGFGVLMVRAAESPAAPDIKKLAEQIGKKDWDALSKEGQAIAKKQEELLDVMVLMKPPQKEGQGPGVSSSGVVEPGIEGTIIRLSKRVTPRDLENAADLKRKASTAAAIAGVATHMPNDKAKQTAGDIKQWQDYAREMHDGSVELIRTLEGKDRDKVKDAALKLLGACTKCHIDYR